MQTLSPTQEIQLSEAINLFLETLLGGGAHLRPGEYYGGS